MRGICAIDTIADSDNHIQIVEINPTTDFSVPFFSNYSNFLSSCRHVKFVCFINTFYMVRYVIFFHIKQNCHLLLCQPNCLIFQLDLQRKFFIWLVHHNFSLVICDG